MTDETMNAEVLLKLTNEILLKHEMVRQKTGGNFNIFDIADISHHEVTICRVLHEIMNPTGSHNQGYLYLKLFFEYVLGIDVSETELKSAKVSREFPDGNNRRIDLFIQTDKKDIPIEVKIYAEDQPGQCRDYLKKARNSSLYYLTLHGNQPSPQSALGIEIDENEIADKKYKGVETISFEIHIMNWLYKCLEQKETIGIASIREIILQLISAFKRITGQSEEGESVEIETLLRQSGSYMKSAISIQSCVKKCQKFILEKVLGSISEKMDVSKRMNVLDYEDLNRLDGFPHNQTIGMSFFYKTVKTEIDIIIRIEVKNGELLVGFCTTKNKQRVKREDVFEKNDLELYAPEVPVNKKMKESDWWISLENLPHSGSKHAINFITPGRNEEYYKLFDENGVENFATRCVDQIKMMYLSQS
jgi:hypothetical protein